MTSFALSRFERLIKRARAARRDPLNTCNSCFACRRARVLAPDGQFVLTLRNMCLGDKVTLAQRTRPLWSSGNRRGSPALHCSLLLALLPQSDWLTAQEPELGSP